MTQDEFREWLRGHRAAFPGVSAWLVRLDDAHRADDAAPAAADTLRTWYAVLKDVDLAAAKEATHAMARGDLEEPKGFDRHPATIRGHALGRRKRAAGRSDDWGPRLYPDGSESFRCQTCHDWGTVTVWHPQSYSAVLRGERDKPGALATCSVACSCAAGDRFAPQCGYRYDPAVMLLGPTWQTLREAADELVEFLARRYQGAAVGHAEFANFA